MNKKPLYKLIDGKGRVLIPKELRTASGMDYGDIVRLGLSNGTVSVQKVDIIEIGDQSPEAVEAYVRAAFKTMPDDTCRFALYHHHFFADYYPLFLKIIYFI